MSPKLTASGPNFLRTGSYSHDGGYVGDFTSSGYWWSSISLSSVGGHGMGTFVSGIYPQGALLRGDGFAVRCVVREGCREE